jgi:hypothetical protein
MATKYITNNAGSLTEVATLSVSAGAGSVDKIPSLNASGVLDSTIVNSKNTSAGAGDAGKLVALDSSGKIDSTMMPTGIGADSATFTTTEIIAAGAHVNIFNSTGAKARNADASNGREAHGFTILGAASAASCVVFFEGTNTAVSAKTPGATQFLSGTTPGASTETAPTTAGQIVQRLGVATSATTINFEPQPPITLA